MSTTTPVPDLRVDPETGDARSLFKIPQENWAAFEKKVKALSKRAERHLGHPLRAVPVSYEMIPDGEGGARKVLDVLFTCDFQVKAEGWSFVARIDHSNEAGNIVRAVPNTGFEVPDLYRSAGPACDHCRVNRLRRDTFLLRCDATDEIKQVGKTCLNDFLGHDVMKIALAAELLGLAGEAALAFREFSGLANHRWIEVDEFLAHCAWAVRTFGWVSASEARAANERDSLVVSTRARAFENMLLVHHPKDGEAGVRPTDEDIAFAAAAREWGRAFGAKDGRSDWEHNAYVVAEAEFVEPRSLGIAASVVGVFAKSKARQAQGERLSERLVHSRHVGKEGERLDCQATVIGVRSVEGAMGTMVIHRFLTTEGNLLVWFTGAGAAREGEIVNLRGTVKRHDTREGVRQTVVTRCKISPATASPR